jgi:hypothetical protein
MSFIFAVHKCETPEMGGVWSTNGDIKMDHREIGLDGVDWIDMVQDRDQWRGLVNKVLNFRVP